MTPLRLPKRKLRTPDTEEPVEMVNHSKALTIAVVIVALAILLAVIL